jgi:hypothetical protein
MPKLKLNKPKARPAKSGFRTGGGNPGNSLGPEHESMLIGLTDPFSAEAARAQYPDQGSGRSLTFQQRIAFNLISDANGSAAFCFNPKPNFQILEYATFTGNTANWAATFDAGGDGSTNLLNTYGKSYRPTSFGCRVANTLSATESSGYLIVAKGGIAAISGSTTSNPNNFTSFDQHPYTHGGEWHAVGCPKSSAAYDMKDRAAYDANNDPMDDSWETIYVYLYGAPASAGVGIVEFYFNYEYTPAEDSPIAQLAVPQPVLNIGMQTAINHVQNQHPASHAGPKHLVTAFIKREGKKALLKHVLPFVAKKAALALA